MQYKHEKFLSNRCRKITDEEKKEPDNFYSETATHDFIYEDFEAIYLKSFLGTIQTKEYGMSACHSHIRKFKDAILWGAKRTGSVLPGLFHQEMDIYLQSYQKKIAEIRHTKGSTAKGNLE